MAGRYDNPIPTRFLVPIDCLKIPAQSAGHEGLPPIEWSWLRLLRILISCLKGQCNEIFNFTHLPPESLIKSKAPF